MKLLLVTNVPTPYRIPLFNEFNRQLRLSNMELKVVFAARGYPRRKWLLDMSECQFEYLVLPSRAIRYRNQERISFTYPHLRQILAREKPFLTITNGFSIATAKLWLRSWFVPTPYIIWSGEIGSKNRHKNWARRLQRRMLIQRAVGFIAYGTRARDYLVSLGANEKSIEIAINTVDVEFFSTETERAQLRSKSKKGKARLLYVGHMTPRKGIRKLFLAVKTLARRRQDFMVQLVGDGCEATTLTPLAQKLGIAEYVDFQGFKQKPEMPRYLAEADCFLFPSEYDRWGLVLVEAMAAGLPCISSGHAGATHDLIKHGETGFAMDFSDSEGIANRVDWILKNPERAAQIGRAARAFVSERANLNQSVAGFMRAVAKGARRRS